MTRTGILRVLLFCLLFILSMQQSWTQTKTISGKISDEQGNPIRGASILVKGTKEGSSTDRNGDFTISAPVSATILVISFVGYTSQEVAITSDAAISVSLKTETTSLADVMVIGYGTAR